MKIYFPALDSLRFFASLNIVLLHFSSSSLLSYADKTVFAPILKAPFFTTSVFFLLSGFIYSFLFNEQERIPKFKQFMKERFRRLYPLHIICTLLVFAIIAYRTSHFDNTVFAIKSIALHVSLLWAFVPELGHALNQPSWALSVFFICYALTPVLSKFLNKQNNKTLWLLFAGLWAFVILSIIYFEEWANVPRVFSGVNFFFGIVLGKLFLNNAIPQPKKASVNDLLLLLTMILQGVNIYYFRPINSAVTYYILSPILYSALLLLLANNHGFIVKILSVSWLRAVGKASFYTYLLHCVVIQLLHLYLDKAVLWKYNPFNNLPATIIIMVVLYASCTMYGVIVRRFLKRGIKTR